MADQNIFGKHQCGKVSSHYLTFWWKHLAKVQTQYIAGGDRHPHGGGGQRGGALLQLPEVSLRQWCAMHGICVILWLADGIINPTLSPLLLQVPPLQRAGGQHHLRRHHRRLHQEVPGQDVRWVAETGLLVVMLLELEMKVKQRFSKPPVPHEHCVSTPISHLLTYHGVNVHLA